MYKQRSFCYFFPSWMPFIYFSRLFIQSRTSCIMLNKSVESGHSWLIPDIKGKASLILSVIFAMSFSYMPFHFVDIASILFCWAFYHERVVLKKTLESPLDSKEIQPVHPKGNQSWIVIGRTHTEAETPKFWPLDAISQFIGKDPDTGKDWRQEEKGKTEDEMVGWHHWLDGHEFE